MSQDTASTTPDEVTRIYKALCCGTIDEPEARAMLAELGMTPEQIEHILSQS